MNTQEIRRAEFRRDAGGRQDRVLPGRDGRQVSAGRADAGDAGAARVEGHLLAAAWRGGDGRDARCWRPMGSRTSKCSGRTPKPDGDFPNVPGHVANPENPPVFDAIIVRAQRSRGRCGAGDRSGLRPHRLRGAAHVRRRRAVAHAHRQSALRTAWPITCWRTRRKQRAGFRRSISSSKRSSRRSWSAASATATACGRSATCWSASNGSPRRSMSTGRTCSCTAPRNRTATWPAATSATRTARWRRCCCASWRPS